MRSMFPSTRRPSATTAGRASKVESSSTSCATARVAAAPVPMAMPRSASFTARTSFTPSPVIATTWPRAWSARTISRLRAGGTRPNTACRSIASASSPGSSGRSPPSTGRSASGPSGRSTSGAPSTQALDGRQLLDQHPTAPQAHDPDREGDAREQHEPLRHHAHGAGHRSSQPFPDADARPELAREQQRGGGRDQPGHQAQDAADPRPELRTGPCEPSRLRCQPGGVGLRVDPRRAVAPAPPRPRTSPRGSRSPEPWGPARPLR